MESSDPFKTRDGNEHINLTSGLQFPDDIVSSGYAAPLRIEGEVHDLEVIGRLPHEMEGIDIRNSADHSYPPLHGKDIFLNGDGMVHMVRMQNGHANLTMRYVRTRKLEIEPAARNAL